MKKIYYCEDGWVCERYPNNLVVDNKNRFIEVEDEAYNRTLASKYNFAWRVIDGILIEARYKEDTAEEINKIKAVQMKAELAKIKEDIEQEVFGLVRDDYAEKKARAAAIINELRVLEGKEPRQIK